MKNIRRLICVVLVLAIFLGIPVFPNVFAAASDAEIYDLMTNDMIDPVGIDDPAPVFSWKMKSNVIGQKQTAYQIVVKCGDESVWDSGKVENDISVGIVYDGEVLRSSTEYVWTVTVWDKDGNVTVSPEATFEMGLLEENAFADTYFISYQKVANVSPTIYTIDFDFEIYNRVAGFAFGAVDTENFFCWQINGTEGKLRPHQAVGGSMSKLYEVNIYNNADTTKNILDGKGTSANRGIIYHARISVNGNEVKTWMGKSGSDLTLVDTYTHTTDIPLNLLGFRHAGSERAYYDNFVIVDKNNQTIYSNDFSNTVDNDLVAGNGSIVDGRLYVDASTTYVQKEQENLVENENSVPAYRKKIQVKEGLVSAKLYTSGLGVYESYINGQRVGRLQDDGSVQYYELKPGFTQRNLRQLYSTFDVTWMLTQGQENVLGGVVTGGWWTGVGSNYLGTETAYFAKLILNYADGSQEIINTDTTWKSARFGAPTRGLELTDYASRYRPTSIWGGERYDATVDQSWMLPGYDDSAWGYVKENTEFTGEVTAWEGVPVIVREDLERTPQSLTVYNGATGADAENYGDINVVATYNDGDTIRLKKGDTLVVDFGQNFAGWEYLEFEGEAGTVVTVEHGEWINEPGGNIVRGNDGPGGSLWQVSNRAATANTIYKMAGGGVEKYHPGFSFYGFQAIEITATADITIYKIRGQVVTSVHNDTATMETSDADVNQLLSNIRWGMYSNYLSIPTDCPQRNERHGWTGDAQVFSQAGTYLTDAKSFLTNYLQVLRDAQSLSSGQYAGSYTDVAPLAATYGDDSFGEVGWSDAGIIIPWNLYMMYGDVSVLEEHWDSMVAYMNYLTTTNGAGPTGGALDHLSPEKSGSSFAHFLGVVFYAWDALMMADMANALGKTAEADKYQAVYEQEKRIFQNNYVADDGTLLTYEQASYLFALYLDLLPDENSVAAVTEQLVTSFEQHGNTMQTGFLSTSIITKTLTKIGRNDLAYMLLLQHDNPSWLYSVDQGATTMWERWDTYTAESGWYSTEDSTMNSMNHYAYGAVAGWMYQTLAGIGYDEENPGFKNIILAPAFDARMSSIKSNYESVYGLIQTETKIEENVTTFTAIIPANTTATAKIPVKQGAVLTVNGKELSALSLEKDGIAYIGTENNIAVFDAVAGGFTFVITEQGNQTQTVDWTSHYCEYCKKDVQWAPLSVPENGKLTAGHYYLAEDTTISKIMTPQAGITCLHLNGNKLISTATRAINMTGTRTLNVMDHSGNTGMIYRDAASDSERGSVFNVVVTAKLNIYGGTFTVPEGKTYGEGSVLYADRNTTINMYGGVITGGNSGDHNGGNIYLINAATFNMYGGTIEGGNSNNGNGGNIYIKSEAHTVEDVTYDGGAAFVMYGGVVCDGTAVNGGNIYTEVSADVSGSAAAKVDILGGRVLSGVATASFTTDEVMGGGNIYMAANTTLTIDETGDAETQIYYGTAQRGGNILLLGNCTMNNGAVCYGEATGTKGTSGGGGNIYTVKGSSFTLHDGTIWYGRSQASNYGGNVRNRGTFTMNNGDIARGYAGSGGNNLCVQNTFTINDGYVGDPLKGANILVMSTGKLYVKAGTISAAMPGKVENQNIIVWDKGTVDISGGTFEGNYAGEGGNIFASKGATISISGGNYSGCTGSDIAVTMVAEAVNAAKLTINNATIGSVYLEDSNDDYDPDITISGNTVISKLVRGGTIKPVVNFSGLESNSAIKIYDDAEGEVFGTGSTAAYISSNNGLAPILDGNNLKWVKGDTGILLVSESAEIWYTDIKQAQKDLTDGAYLKNYGADIELVVDDITIDINGQKFALSGEHSVNLFDSANKDFETFGEISIDGTTVMPKCTANGMEYYAVQHDSADSAKWSAHAVEMKITSVALATNKGGMYYYATYNCDDVLAANVDSFGIKYDLYDATGTTQIGTRSVVGVVNGAIPTPGAEIPICLIKNIVGADIDGYTDAQTGEMQIKGTPYVVINGVETTGKTASKSLKDLCDMLDDLITTTADTALKDSYTAYLDRLLNKVWKAFDLSAWTFHNVTVIRDAA